MEFPQRDQCGLKGGDQAGGVHTGLDASEMVVRGGLLPGPTIFAGLILGPDGKAFLRLRKSHDGLCRFLTGKASYHRPLGSTTVFETMRKRRDEAMAHRGLEAEADPMLALGIDEPQAKAASRSTKRARNTAHKHAQQLSSVSVGLGPGLEIEVLAEVGNCMPAIAATASSLWLVFRRVQQELDSRQPRGLRSNGQSSRQPRGPRGSRQYCDDQKTMCSEGAATQWQVPSAPPKAYPTFGRGGLVARGGLAAQRPRRHGQIWWCRANILCGLERQW